MNVLHLNVRSLNNKVLDLDILLAQEKPDILCLTEHWMPEAEIQNVNVSSYSLVNYSSRSGMRGGGTAIYAKQDFKSQNIHTHVLPIHKIFEFSLFQSVIKKKHFIILAMYRSPQADFGDFLGLLNVLLDEIYDPDKFLIICGDFNIDFLKPSGSLTSLLELLTSFDLRPHVSEFTRVSGTGNSCIDNIISNVPGVVSYQSVITDISDHYGQKIAFNLSHDKPKDVFVKKRFFTSCNILNFQNLLSTENWDDIFYQEDPNVQYDIFKNIFTHHFTIAFPVCSSRIKSTPTGVNTEIKNYANRIKDLYIFYKQTNSQNILNQHKEEKRKYKQFIFDFKCSLNENIIANAKNKNRAMWKILNKECNKNTKKNIRLNSADNSLIEDPINILNTFKDQFNLSSDIHYNANNYDSEVPRNPHSLFLEPVDENELFRIIMALPNKYSSGMDEIPIFLLKHIAYYISKPLTFIINNCFSLGTFPDSLKMAKVVPIFKKGDIHDPANYRPVSLLSAVSKVFERSIYNRLLPFLLQCNILSPNQFGYLPGKSTEMAIYQALTEIIMKLDRNEKVAGLYFDLSKAFDTINFTLLFIKLERYGVRGVALGLLESYLQNRSQSVNVRINLRDYFSDPNSMCRGVPQGSILGPLLFLLYVNDLPDYLLRQQDVDDDDGDGMACQFVDDTSVILSSSSIASLSVICSRIVAGMAEWCEKNYLCLNGNKTGLILFNKNKIPTQSLYVRHELKSIPNIETIKFLGVNIDSSICWEIHAVKLRSKLNSACALIRRLRYIVSSNSIQLFYFAYVQSQLNYGISFWGSSRFARDISRAQKRIVRCMRHLHPLTSCRPYFIEMGLLTVPGLYFMALVTFVKKNPSFFLTNRDEYAPDMAITTRGRNELRAPYHATSFFEKGPYFKCIKAYRLLPLEIRNIEGIERFKREAKRFALSKCFYSFNFDQ